LARNLKKNYSLDFNESVLLLMHWELETWGIISAFVLRQTEAQKNCAEIADRRACHHLQYFYPFQSGSSKVKDTGKVHHRTGHEGPKGE